MPSAKFLNTNPGIITRVINANKYFPNNKLPLLIYRNAFNAGKQKNKTGKALQTIFLKNHWKNSWTNGIYFFHHYHSNTHECLGIASGKAHVIFGGPGKRSILVQKGDLIIIPAGLGHKCTRASPDFICIGAYPSGKQYDTKLGKASEYEDAKKRIGKIPVPKYDPLFGKEGFIKSYWNS